MNHKLVLIEWEDSQLDFQSWKLATEQPRIGQHL